MKTKPKRGRPKLPAAERGKIVSLYLKPEDCKTCLRYGKTVQDGVRALIARG